MGAHSTELVAQAEPGFTYTQPRVLEGTLLWAYIIAMIIYRNHLRGQRPDVEFPRSQERGYIRLLLL